MSSSEEEDKTVQECMIDKATGLPQMSENAKAKALSQQSTMLPAMVIVPRLIGLGIAIGIYALSSPSIYDSYLKKLNAMDCDADACLKDDMQFGLNYGYIYLSLGVLSLMVNILNIYPMVWKGQVMPGNAGNLRSNMMIYKVNTPEGADELPAVVMMEEGDVGGYNRSNRALFHFNENGLPVLLNIVAASVVFPSLVFGLTVLYCVARVWYQVAYARGGYGMSVCQHGVPFLVQGILVAPILEGLVWVIGVRMLTL